MFLDILFLERHQDWDTLTQQLENVLSWLYVLSQTWANFMILIISSFRNKSQNKSSISIFSKANLTIFLRWLTWYWITWHYEEETKLWPFTDNPFGYNEDSISFFIFFNVKWNMMTTKHSSICVHWTVLNCTFLQQCTVLHCTFLQWTILHCTLYTATEPGNLPLYNSW